MAIKIYTFLFYVVFLSFFNSNAQSKEERAQKWVQEKVIDRIKRGNSDLNITPEQHEKLMLAQLANIEEISKINLSAITEEEKEIQRKIIYNKIYPMVSNVLDPIQLQAWKDGKPTLAIVSTQKNNENSTMIAK